jgi:hypothetical protein
LKIFDATGTIGAAVKSGPQHWRFQCQRIANESHESNVNKRRQSSSDSSGFTGDSRERDPLITVWLEVT